MKLAKTVMVGGHKIKILFPYEFATTTTLWAQYDDCMKEIRIKAVDGGGSKLSDGFIFESLIHELLHTIDFDRHINLFNDDDGERAVEALSSGIYAFLVANKKEIIRFIKDYE